MAACSSDESPSGSTETGGFSSGGETSPTSGEETGFSSGEETGGETGFGTGGGTGEETGFGTGEETGEETGDESGGTTGTELPPDAEDYSGFPSEELGILIVGPSAESGVTLQNSTIQISGVLFGDAAAIVVECGGCGSEQVELGTYWSSPPLTLQPGDNEITVTAISTTGAEASDQVTVTYTPLFDFDGAPTARPAAIFVNEPTTLFLSIGLKSPNYYPDSVKLVQVDESGAPVGEWPMSDDGVFEISGDEVPGDGVHTRKLFQVSHPTVETVQFRVEALVDMGGGQSQVMQSAVVFVDVLEHVVAGACTSARGVIESAQAVFDQTVAQVGVEAAQEATLAVLAAAPSVIEHGPSRAGFSVWARFDSGLLGVVIGSEPGTRGSLLETQAQAASNNLPIMSRTVHALSPMADALAGVDETVNIESIADAVDCPPLTVGRVTGAAAGVEAFRATAGTGITAIVTHGGVAFGDLDPALMASWRWEHEGAQAIMATGEAVFCDGFGEGPKSCDSDNPEACGKGSECIFTDLAGTLAQGYCLNRNEVDLRMGRLALGGHGGYVTLPSFFREAARTGGGYPQSLVYLGTCHGLWNGSLAMELYAAGARAIAGYTGVVSDVFAYEKGTAFFSALINEVQFAGTAAVPLADPQYPDTWFRLVGATNLDVNESGIINADFETADSTGWSGSGDARVISQLGATLSANGKFMGIVSTGLGLTQQVGEFSQRFCIESDKRQFRMDWNFYSEEFLTYCGSSYQDSFSAVLEGDNGEVVSVVDVVVDNLCPEEACCSPVEVCEDSCASQYEALIPADVSFDKGEVYHTGWRESVVSLGSLPGSGPVTLRFHVSDVKDSIYDTVVLIDDLRFE